MRVIRARPGVLVIEAAFLFGSAVNAQQIVRSSTPDSVDVIAGEHYAVSGIRRFFFGKEYRSLWTTRLGVEQLDLSVEGGGLTPVPAGGGFQTKSLWLRGADGYMYGFRSVDKDPSDVIPPDLRETFVEDIVKDQTSSQHPGAPAVVAPLLEAAVIAHTNPRLVVLPDDPRLGEHRERFAGALGFFERRATIEPGVPPFAGALEIIDSEELFARTKRGSSDRVDLPTYLEARLVDYLVGDWDRHQGQWNWMRLDSDSITEWVPVPEDRDQAFARYDGVLLWLLRQYVPQLLNFGDKLPKPAAFAFNGRDLDRTYLVELEEPVWDSVVAVLVARMTDSVIEAAVHGLPPEYYALEGARLTRALKMRRDQLPERAEDYYRMLAGEVDIHATDETETVVVLRAADGSSSVAISQGVGSTLQHSPYWHRRFSGDETEELRLYLNGGSDVVIVRGEHGGIPLRIVGGGEARVVDSSGTGNVFLYATGNDYATGRVSVDRRPFVLPPKERPEELPPRDWGHIWRSVAWGGYGPDVGVFIGGGGFFTHYGFRKLPYASKVLMRAGIATAAQTGRADVFAEVYRRNSRVHGEIDLRISGIEVLRYNGLGNETVLTRGDDYYRVRQQLLFFEPSLVLPAGSRGDIGIGLSMRFRNTREQEGRILADTTLYGEDGFGQLGFQGRFEFDTRDTPAAATRGLFLRAGGSFFPSLWDVDGSFGEVHGEASTYLSATGVLFRPTLAFRAGGKKVWGGYPFQEAAYIGDTRSVRLGRQHRYGGDASVYGNAELRLHLADIFLLLPAQIGIFGLGDVGRVFLEGETSDKWHWAAGGGLWLAYLGPGNTLSLAVAKSEAKVGVYAIAGFAF